MVEATGPRTFRVRLQTIPLQEPSGHPSRPPQWSSTACPSVLLCTVLGSCALGHLGGGKLISPGSITALSGLRPRGRGCHLSLCLPPPISTFLLAPGVRSPTEQLCEVRAPGEAVVVPPRDRAPSHKAKPQLLGSSLSPPPMPLAISEQTAWGLFC